MSEIISPFLVDSVMLIRAPDFLWYPRSCRLFWFCSTKRTSAKPELVTEREMCTCTTI